MKTKGIFSLIEKNQIIRSSEEDEQQQQDHRDERLTSTAIKFLLVLNLYFDYPQENLVMLTMLSNEQTTCRELIERLILLLNRSVDPVHSNRQKQNSVVKFFSDLFSENSTNDYLYDSDRRLLIEIISRELSDRPFTDEATTHLLSLLELILRSDSITSDTCTRTIDLQNCFRAHLQSEMCLEQNRFIILEIIRENSWLSTNDMTFYV